MSVKPTAVSVGTTPVRIDSTSDKQSIAFWTASGEVAMVETSSSAFATGAVVGTSGISLDIEASEAVWVVAAAGTVTVYVVQQGVGS